MKHAADYWKNCKKCDGNPSLPEWIWQSVKDYNKAPRPVIPMVDLPDELVNWYDPSPWEKFNKFMNQHFGNAPAQGTQPVLLPWIWELGTT